MITIESFQVPTWAIITAALVIVYTAGIFATRKIMSAFNITQKECYDQGEIILATILGLSLWSVSPFLVALALVSWPLKKLLMPK